MLLLTALNSLNSMERIEITSSLANVRLRELLSNCIAQTITRFGAVNPDLPDNELATEFRKIRAELQFYQELESLINELLRNQKPKRG